MWGASGMPVFHSRVAPLAVVDGEGHLLVTCATELAVQDVLHQEVPGRPLLDRKDVRMAVRAVEPSDVFEVGEVSGGDHRPGRWHLEFLVVENRLEIRLEDALLGLDQPAILCVDPVDLVAVIPRGELERLAELRESAFLVGRNTRVALRAVLLRVPERRLAVVAGAAEEAATVRFLGDSRPVCLHLEGQLEVAHTTGVAGAVRPVREHDGIFTRLA